MNVQQGGNSKEFTFWIWRAVE